jgi:nucleoid DNA-binding protein
MTKEPEFHPDIHDYLESAENSKSVNVKGFDELIYKIRAHTGLSYDASSLVLKYFFQDIRNAMLRGDIVALNGFGKFFISSPKNTNNKQKVFAKFKPYTQLANKLNERN